MTAVAPVRDRGCREHNRLRNACGGSALMTATAPSRERWSGSPPGRDAGGRRRCKRRLRIRSRRPPARRPSPIRPRKSAAARALPGDARARGSWTDMRNADSEPRHWCGLHNLHMRPARAVLRSASCRRRSRARDRRAPSPARGSGRNATGPRPWAACSARSGRQRGARHSAGGRVRAAPRGKARRRSGSPPADGGRMMCIVRPPDAPGGGACPRRGRHGGTAPDRGRHIACPRRGPSHDGRGRRPGVSRHSRYTP